MKARVNLYIMVSQNSCRNITVHHDFTAHHKDVPLLTSAQAKNNTYFTRQQRERSQMQSLMEHPKALIHCESTVPNHCPTPTLLLQEKGVVICSKTVPKFQLQIQITLIRLRAQHSTVSLLKQILQNCTTSLTVLLHQKLFFYSCLEVNCTMKKTDSLSLCILTYHLVV